MKPEPDTTVETVKGFWESHVNNEYYTDASRASEEYFDEIESQRYDTHYHLREFFESHAGDSGRLLEIGCGIGVDSIQLAKCGYDVTAVDLTESALEVARDYAKLRGVEIDFRRANAEQLEFDDDAFDVVYSFGVLHHTPDIEKALAEAYRVLKPGGTAFIMLYARDSLVNLVHRVFRLPYESPRDHDDHCPVVYTFSRKGVKGLFESYRTVDVTTEYPFTYGFGPLCTKTPLAIRRSLGHAIGWHLMITATK